MTQNLYKLEGEKISTMKIKNAGSMRIRLGKTFYLKPNEVLEVTNAEGNLILRKHSDVINVTPAKPVKVRPKISIKPTYKKLDLEVKKNDIK